MSDKIEEENLELFIFQFFTNGTKIFSNYINIKKGIILKGNPGIGVLVRRASVSQV